MQRIILSNNVYQDILNVLKKADNKYEVGGILLGFRADDCIHVVAATYPETIENPLEFSFLLDGEYHAREVEKKLADYSGELNVIGLWHSHIYDVAYFSEQDNVSNNIFSDAFGEIISVIVYFSRKYQEIKIPVCSIISGNQEKICEVIIEGLNIFNKPVKKSL